MTKLFIGGLPPNTNEKEVLALVNQFGCLHSIRLIKRDDSGKCRGFCFIEMQTEVEAQLVIDGLNGQLFKERTLTVKLSEERISNPAPKVYVKVVTDPRKKRPRIKH